ncbi:MAG: VWA domain-containing protein [Verrucomicrobia bacterium]|nr:VWA domain-containing protein [Verrucomicrobiota bacterium]
MNFLNPIAFLFALTMPAVVLLYLLKKRRKSRLVSSTVLWQRYLADTQANSPFQKFRNHALMWLQLALLALAVGALARPFWRGSAAPSRLRVLVLDGSASMQSVDVRPSRFESARAQAREWINGLRDTEQAMILLAGAVTQVKQSPTRDKAALRRALDSCAASDSGTRLAEALQTAAAFTYEKKGEETRVSGEIHLFSDGASVDLGELANKNLPLIYHRVGGEGRNLGIVSMDVRADPEDPTRRLVLANVFNASASRELAQVELLFSNQVVEAKSVEILPTNSAAALFSLKQPGDGVLTVRLLAPDDLAVDNSASTYSFLPRPVSILLLTRGNRFLEKGLRAAPRSQVTVAAEWTGPTDAFDLTVLDRTTPATWPATSVLAIGVQPTNWFAAVVVEKSPPIVDWNHAHPVLRQVNLDNVDLAESQLVDPPPWGVSLAQSQQKALIVAGERERKRVIWVGFDPLQSNWPLRISFPIFLANAVEWLNPATQQTADLLLRVGEPIRHTSRQPVTEAVVTRPDGTSATVIAQRDGHEIFYGGTDRAGVYTVRAGTNVATFCVNLLNAPETQIASRTNLVIGRYAGVSSVSTSSAPSDQWRWWAVAALALLMFEWWFYHKRTA